MKIIKTEIEGLLIIKPKVYEDERGLFFESWNKAAFRDVGLDIDFDFFRKVVFCYVYHSLGD